MSELEKDRKEITICPMKVNLLHHTLQCQLDSIPTTGNRVYSEHMRAKYNGMVHLLNIIVPDEDERVEIGDQYNSKLVGDLQDLINIQGTDGNWNSNEYMRGMYNGMEVMMAAVEHRDGVFKDAPAISNLEDYGLVSLYQISKGGKGVVCGQCLEYKTGYVIDYTNQNAPDNDTDAMCIACLCREMK